MFKELFHENCLTFWLLKTTPEQQEARQQFKHLRAQTIRNDCERFFFSSDTVTLEKLRCDFFKFQSVFIIATPGHD